MSRVLKKANVYFDGKCVSHTVLFRRRYAQEHRRDLPVHLTFNTARARSHGNQRPVVPCAAHRPEPNGRTIGAGETFSVPGNSSFDIETLRTLDYVCHFG